MTPVPEECPVNPNLWSQQPVKPTPKMGVTDWIKVAFFCGALAGIWARIEATGAVTQEKFAVQEKKDQDQDKAAERDRAELRSDLKEIKDQLARLVENRRR